MCCGNIKAACQDIIRAIDNNRLMPGEIDTHYKWLRSQMGRREVIINEVDKRRPEPD